MTLSNLGKVDNSKKDKSINQCINRALDTKIKTGT